MLNDGSYTLSGDVGDCPKGTGNALKDVLIIRSLLNAYARKKKLTPLLSSASTGVVVDAVFIARIKHFQEHVAKSPKPDGIVTKGAGTWRKLKSFLKSNYTIISGITDPKNGLITWKVEGSESRSYILHSRSLHVPSSSSGLTLGRGYDMKERDAAKIINDLTAAGVNAVIAKRISLAATLSGDVAKRFVINNDLIDYEISPAVQLKLFDTVYKFYEKSTKSRVLSASHVPKYGKVDWNKLNKGIKTVLIDLRYRGDYNKHTVLFLQKHIAANDLAGFKKAMSNTANWTTLRKQAKSRFDIRVAYLAAVPAQPIPVKVVTKKVGVK